MIEVDGFLFVGDPHLTASRLARRTDKDMAATILGKLEEAVDIANERNLLMLPLGDMFQRPTEDDESVKTRLIRLLRRLKIKPISNVGNHDCRGHVLSDHDTLAVIGESGCLDLIRESGPATIVRVGDNNVGIGGTPAGQDIPTDVRKAFDEPVDKVIWLTHHDVGFDGAYPGCILPHEIKGCGLVVNGHIHTLKKPVKAGKTTWFNPGNITRYGSESVDHTPAVWSLDVTGKLESHALTHKKEAISLVGRLIDATIPYEVAESDDPAGADSAFVDILSQETSTDLEKTGDGSVVLEEIERKFEAHSVDPSVRGLIMELLKGASEDSPGKKPGK